MLKDWLTCYQLCTHKADFEEAAGFRPAQLWLLWTFGWEVTRSTENLYPFLSAYLSLSQSICICIYPNISISIGTWIYLDIYTYLLTFISISVYIPWYKHIDTDIYRYIYEYWQIWIKIHMKKLKVKLWPNISRNLNHSITELCH